MPEAASAQEAPELKIQLLGTFRVQVSSRSIPARAWRPKTGRLLKLLALAPGHSLHREQVLDVLWPDLGVAAAANNLHRTLHATRRALQPELAPSVPSAFLHLRGDTLSLSAPGSLWIDVEAFELAAATARHAQEPAAYQTALELYTGDLLPEDRYED